MSEFVPAATAYLARFAAIRATAATAAPVAPIVMGDWQMPATDQLVRMDGCDSDLPTEIYVRVRTDNGVVTAAVADARAVVQRDDDDKLMIRAPITADNEADLARAADASTRDAARVAIFQTMMAMQVPADPVL